MTGGIEELTFELLALQEEKRVREGAIKDLQVRLREKPDPASRRFCEDSIVDLRVELTKIDDAIAQREQERALLM